MFLLLDACGAYHAVRTKPDSRACIAFISPLGMFQYICMPFGLANSESMYSRMLDMAMKKWTEISGHQTWILTLSREPWAHFGYLAQVVLAHVAIGIKMQPCKTKRFQSEVEYLGHKISKGKVLMIPECRRSRTSQ